MKKQRKWLLFLPIGMMGCCFVVYMLTMFPQDYKLFQYQKIFSKVQHPVSTSFIRTYGFVGVDASDRLYPETFGPPRCYYLAGEVREDSGTEESIREFYIDQTIPIDQEEMPIITIFHPITSEDVQIMHMEGAGFEIMDLLNLQHLLKPSDSYYFVYSRKYLSSAPFDIRCK